MALETSPTNPAVGDQITLSLTGTFGTVFQFDITGVPNQSTLITGVLVDSSGKVTNVFTPDVAGAYAVTGYAYRQVAGSASYDGDPNGTSRLDLLVVQTDTIYVGTNLDLKIVTKVGHGATLRLQLNNNHVRVASFVSPVTDVGRVATLGSAVTAAVAALVGEASSSVGENLITRTAELLTKYNAHRQSLVFHNSSDDVDIPNYKTPNSTELAIQALNDLSERITGHQVAGTFGGTWHTTDDTANPLVVAKASDTATASVLIADLCFRVYERHIVDTDVHLAEDSVNSLEPPTAAPLSSAIVAYLDAVVALTPTAPTGENQGAVTVSHKYGFKAA